MTETIPDSKGGQFTIDAGPESFITRKPEVWELASEMGILDRVVNPGSETRNMYVLKGGKPIEIPLSPVKFIRSTLMTGRGKLRMLQEPFIPPKRDGEDESLAEFVTRRLGREALDEFIGPVLAGIYNTNPDTQSILTTSPVMREMEMEHGGLFKGALGRMRAARRVKKVENGQPRPPRFITFQNGAEELVEALVARLEGDLRLRVEIERICPFGEQYEILLKAGQRIFADAIIFATPANVTNRLIENFAQEAAKCMATIRHENIGTISLVYQSKDVQRVQPIHGLMIPRREKRKIDALTWTSNKMPSRAPAGYSLIRVFFGGNAPYMAEYNDSDLLNNVRAELRELLGIRAIPLDYRVQRWPKSFPQADVGHLDLVNTIEGALPAGLYVAGSSYRGIGVPDCIRQGRDAAQKAIESCRLKVAG
ncbi:MAG: protoporphyrinogen oxidase [Anaerolineae bacterium]|nr:protoporphyrinogen oxidase [Anaerolineae bacterium]